MRIAATLLKVVAITCMLSALVTVLVCEMIAVVGPFLEQRQPDPAVVPVRSMLSSPVKSCSGVRNGLGVVTTLLTETFW